MTGDAKDFEARVTRSRALVKSVIDKISATEPAVRSKGSPIAAMLEPYADEIRAALDRGWSAGAIARHLAEAHVAFTEESIRLRIAKMFRSTPSAKAKATSSAFATVKSPRRSDNRSAGREALVAAPPVEAHPTSVDPKRSGGAHAGYMEDPR